MSDLMKQIRDQVGTKAELTAMDRAYQTLLARSEQNAMSSSLESIDANRLVEGNVDGSALNNVLGDISSSLESLSHSLGSDFVVSNAGREAAAIASLMGAAIRQKGNRQSSLEALNRPGKIDPSKYGPNAVEVTPSYVSAGAPRVPLAVSLEAYDEQSLRTTTVYSELFNVRHGNQDAMTEAFFPTVTVGVDEAGYAISLNIVEVQDDLTRDLSGKLESFGRRNVIHAVIDDSILRDDQTKLIPIHRTENAGAFVAGITPTTIKKDGKDVKTAPLAMGKSIDLIGVSQDDAILATGGTNHTDQIASGLRLATIYVKVGAEIIPFPVRHLDGSNFWAPPQNNYRMLQLVFDSKNVLVSGDEKTYDNADTVVLKPILDGGFKVRLRVGVNASVNADKGDTLATQSIFEVASVRLGDVELALTDAAAQPIVDLFADAKIVGWTPDGYLTNVNRRQRGQLLNNDFYTQIYPVTTRAPFTITRSQVLQEYSDAADIAALTSTVGISVTNDGLNTILEADELLARYVNNEDDLVDAPRVLGIARSALKPFYERHEIDVAAELMALETKDKTQNIQAVLVNRIRDAVYRAYVESAYKPSVEARNGGKGVKPVVLIGTDPYTANYLMLHGDLRTLGEHFEVCITSTQNKKFRGKIFVSFGTKAAMDTNQPDPYHFGNMAWKPELVYSLPTHYQGENSKQITVQPTYAHVVNLPILIRFDVTNLSSAVGDKTSLDVNWTNKSIKLES